MIYDEDPFRRRPEDRWPGENDRRGLPEWRKTGQMAFRTRAVLQNQAIGWLRKGYSSLGGGTVVRFPRSWRSPGECRFRQEMEIKNGMDKPLLEAAIRVLVRSGESVKYSNGVYVVNGVSESPDDVIAYADDLYQVDKSIPLHDRAYVSGRPRKRVEK